MNEKEIKKLREAVRKQFPANSEKASFCFNVLLKHHLMHQLNSNYNEQSHLLLTGKTGSGKSHMIETIVNLFHLPFIITDATALTESGYQGRSVEDIYRQLYEQAGKDCAAVSKAVVFIDEFDKLMFKDDESHDVSCRGVQYSLLKSMDGIEVPLHDMPQLNSRVRFDSAAPAVNTRGILFIAAGAFSECKQPVSREEITESGFYPELIARFSSVLHLNDITEEQLIEILNAGNSYLCEYEKIFEYYGKKVVFTPEIRNYIAMKAAAMNYNIRGIKIVTDEMMIPLLERLGDSSFRTLTIRRVKEKPEFKFTNA